MQPAPPSHAMSTAVLAVVVAQQDFHPTEPDCLALRTGDRVLVFKRDASGWAYGARVPALADAGDAEPVQGWFPADFCAPASEAEAAALLELQEEPRTPAALHRPSLSAATLDLAGASQLSVASVGYLSSS